MRAAMVGSRINAEVPVRWPLIGGLEALQSVQPIDVVTSEQPRLRSGLELPFGKCLAEVRGVVGASAESVGQQVVSGGDARGADAEATRR